MSDPNDNPGYATAIDAYWQAGWRGILPLKHGFKGGELSGLPKGYTGYSGVDPSYPDLLAWSEQFPDGNLALRLPEYVVGVDVDNYRAKRGALTFAEAIKRWGPLPPTVRTSSRPDNPISGIRLFRVPAGTQLETKIAFPDLGIGDVEIIQHHHRYAVSWPSLHPEGGLYLWRDDADQLVGIPNIDGLPDFPQAWIDGLRVQPKSSFDGPVDFNVVSALTDGEPSVLVSQRFNDAVKELNLPGASRHDVCTRHVMAIARLGKSGEPGVKRALQMLCDVLVAVRRADGSGSEDVARGEFVRMLTNDRIAHELSRPGITDWIGELIVEEMKALESPQPVTSPAELATGTGLSTQSDNEGRSTQPTRPFCAYEHIERGFWQSRESLAMIYQTSMSRMAPPWGTLAHCAARALAMIPPKVVLPPIISGPGSLNWFVATVARASGGKGASKSAADVLVPKTGFVHRKIGSGEGLIAAYGKIAGDDSPPEHESIMFTTNEIDVVKSLTQRSSSTLMPVLREGFFGEDLGFAYAAKDKRRMIPEHSYRMTLVIAAQPERMDWLLADTGGGTPQRFMWFPADDVRISRKKPWETGPLTLPALTEWIYPRTIIVPPEAQELIESECEKRAQGLGEAMDGHALFCREKFAYALAVLDGRTQMTSEDWELSEIASDISLYTRSLAADAIKDAARIEALDRGEIRGIELAAADESKQYEEAERIRHALRWCLTKIESAAANGGISTRELTQAADSKRVRRWVPAALQIGQSNGLIAVIEGSTTWIKL